MATRVDRRRDGLAAGGQRGGHRWHPHPHEHHESVVATRSGNVPQQLRPNGADVVEVCDVRFRSIGLRSAAANASPPARRSDARCQRGTPCRRRRP